MMELIPAIDLIDGKVVRLTEGDYTQKKVYADDPFEMAKKFEDVGIHRLHLVDLDGAKKGEVVNWKVLEGIASKTNLKIDFGGGVKKEEDVKRILESGACWVTIGSMAVKSPELVRKWIGTYGAERFFLGADVREEKIAINGWQEITATDLYAFIHSYLSIGLNYVFCTDISKDGRLGGAAIDLYKKILTSSSSIKLVASGGVSTVDDLYLLQEAGCNGAIIGKAIYENRISLEDLKKFNYAH